MKRICVVCCCYNEAENIEELYNQIVKEIEKLRQYEWSILFEDNCSTDGTDSILRSLAERDQRVKVIFNQSNYGASRSSANAIMAADADAIIGMASDLEEPPSLIPEFVNAWEAGNKVIMGQYATRTENKFMHLCRSAYYRIMNALANKQLPRNVTGFGLYDMEVINQIRPLREYNLVMRFLCLELGYEAVFIPYDKPKRRGGKSSFSLLGYYRYAIETLTLITDSPLHMATPIGFIMFLASGIIGLILLLLKLLNGDVIEMGTAPIVVGMFFIGGLQLLFIGIICEYLSRGLKKISNRPCVIEKERINFESN